MTHNNSVQSKPIEPLENLEEIQQIITEVEAIEKLEAWYKRLKKFQAQRIDKELTKLAGKKDHLKSVAKATLEAEGHKSLNFPGVGKVVLRNTKGVWQVNDEEALKAVLKSELSKSELSDVLTVQTVEKIAKRNLNKVLDRMKDEGKTLEDEIVTRNEDSVSVSISIDEDYKVEMYEEDEDKGMTSDSLDALEV